MCLKSIVLIFVIIFSFSLDISFISPPTPSLISSPNTGQITIKTQTSSSSSSSSSCFIDIDHSLITYWNFESIDDDIHDSSMIDHDLYQIRSIKRIKGSRGYRGIFNGLDSSIYISFQNPEMNLIGSNMSISMFVKLWKKNDTDGGTSLDEVHNLIGQWSEGGFLFRVGSTGKVVMYIVDDQTPMTYETIQTGYTIVWGEEYHFVFQLIDHMGVYTKVKLFVDSIEVFENSVVTIHAGGAKNEQLKIGRWSNFPSLYGEMDEIMVFSRILSKNEINSLYDCYNNNEIEETYYVQTGHDLSYYGCAIDEEGVKVCTEKRGLSDGIKPVISNVNMNLKGLEVVITWETSQECDSLIDFGYEAGNLEYSKVDHFRKSFHSITLKRLLKGTKYFVKVRSRDESNDEAIPYEFTFQTVSNISYYTILPQIIEFDEKRMKLDATSWDIVTNSEEYIANYLKDKLSDIVELPIVIGNYKSSTTKRIMIDTFRNGGKDAIRIAKFGKYPNYLGKEGYVLKITPDNIIVVANEPNGCFYGIQTLLYLIRHDLSCDIVKIIDWPDQAMRGAFSQIPELVLPSTLPLTSAMKDTIDFMALIKFNTLVVYQRISDEFWPNKFDDDCKQVYSELIKYCNQRFINVHPSVGGLKAPSGLPIELIEGWWMKDIEFTFGGDNKLYPDDGFVNMVNNGGFELGDYSNWVQFGSGGVNVVSSDSYEGSYSIQCDDNTGVQQEFMNIIGGSGYYLTYYAKGAKPYSQIVFGKDGKYTYGRSTTEKVDAVDWVKCAQSFRSYNESTQLRIRVKGVGGTAYFDDIRLYRIDGSLKNVLRNDNTDIEITNLDKSVIYEEGVDYTITSAIIDHQFVETLDSFEVDRIPSGSISFQESVLVSYDVRANYNLKSHLNQPPVLSDPHTFDDYYGPGIKNAMETTHPDYIHLKNDEIRGFFIDSRNVKRDITPPELLAEFLNKIDDEARSIDSDVSFIMWDDMFSPSHNGHYDYQYSYSGGKGALSDIVTKKMLKNREKWVFNIWVYYLRRNIMMRNSIDFFNENDHKYIISSACTELQTPKAWSEFCAGDDNCLGAIMSWWKGGVDHIPYYIEDADNFWNTRYKSILFESFEYTEIDFFENWIFSNSSLNGTDIISNVLNCGNGLQEGDGYDYSKCCVNINSENEIISKTIEVRPKKEYILSVYIRRVWLGSEFPIIKVIWMDNHENILEISERVDFSDQDPTWIYHNYELYIPESPSKSKYAKLILSSRDNENHFYFDTLNFKESFNDPPPSSPKYLIIGISIALGIVFFLFVVIVIISILYCTFCKSKSKYNEVDRNNEDYGNELKET